ncbi:MAG: stage II sporulation protein M [Desulfomonile tiedjei]|nr:stage II sporulation protein M [Desulfomonile tiedjei]
MNINQFIAERKGEWEKLEGIAKDFKPGKANRLSRADLWQLGKLYTAAVSDLALLKSSDLALDPGNEVIAYLNSLVIKVHGMIYRKPAFRWMTIPRFILTEFPGAVRKTLIYTAVAWLIFASFFLVGFVLALTEPQFIELVVPQRIISTVEKGQVWFSDLHAVAPLASSQLMTHNVSVTFLVIASGITFGVGTVYLLALNGLLIGTVAALCFRHGLSLEFWSFLLPHGSIELSAIFIAGGAGLILGHALLDPGPYKRVEILSVRSRPAGRLALGCVFLLIMAGLVEAFLSPSPLPAWFKIAFGIVMFASLWAFLLMSGRHAGEAGADEDRSGMGAGSQ